MYEGRAYCNVHAPVGECAICMDAITKKNACTLACGHVLHRPCMRKWLDRGLSVTCPMCRTQLGADDLAKLSSGSLRLVPKTFNVSMYQLHTGRVTPLLEHDALVDYLRNILAQQPASPPGATGSGGVASAAASAVSGVLYRITLLN
jgi:Ring finger domain